MIRQMICSTLVLVAAAASAVRADPKDDVTAAVQKLTDSASYSWTTTTTFGQGSFTQTGKTEKDGYTNLSLAFGDNTTDIYMKGGKSVIKTDAGWQTPEEIAAADQNGGGGFNPNAMAARMVQNFKAPADTLKTGMDAYQNIQKTDDGYTADMTDDQTRQALNFGGRRGGGGTPPAIKNSKGTVKIWITDGAVSKYEIHLTGTVTFNDQDRDIDTTTTVELKDVGSTKIDVPDAAKAKLNG